MIPKVVQIDKERVQKTFQIKNQEKKLPLKKKAQLSIQKDVYSRVQKINEVSNNKEFLAWKE